MEFAIGALTAIGSTVAEGGAAVAGAAGTAASAAGGIASSVGSAGSLFAGILGGAASLTSAYAAQRAGEARAQAQLSQATDATVDAAQQNINAETRQTSLRNDLLTTLGKRDVAYAASGLDLSFGTPVVARQEAITAAGRAIAGDQATTDETRSRLLQRAAQLRISAGQSVESGDTAAVGDILTGGYRLLRRG